MFVFIGVALINDMNSTASMNGNSSVQQTNTQNIIDDDLSISSNKPLRIILTIATNIEPQRTYLFLSSYRRWHPTEHNNKIYQLYMFTQFSEEKYLTELQRMAEYFEINLVDMDPMEDELDLKYIQTLDIKMKYIRINKRRFFIFKHWLELFPNSDDIDAIFLSDANDVKFQVDLLLFVIHLFYIFYPCTQCKNN